MPDLSFIKKRLKEIGRDQISLAEYLGLPQSRISNMIQGTRGIHADEILPMAEFLEIDVLSFLNYLSGRSDTIQTSNVENEQNILIECFEVIDFLLKRYKKNMTIRDKVLFAYELIKEEQSEKDTEKRKQNIIKLADFLIRKKAS